MRLLLALNSNHDYRHVFSAAPGYFADMLDL